MKRNYVAIVIDKSSSMSSLTTEAHETLKRTVDTLREQADLNDQDTTVTIVEFADRANVSVPATDVDSLSVLQPFIANGWTALLDGVGLAIATLSAQKVRKRDDVSYLVIVITDGEENASKTFGYPSLKALIAQCQNTSRWTFAFNVPPRTADRVAAAFGVSRQNVREWEATTRGMIETRSTTMSAVASFSSARAAGQTMVNNFYDVTTDLSKVKAKDVKKLNDVSGHIKAYDVPKEQTIKEFVEAKTKKPYVIGQAYYQLMKPEKVQPQKDVLLQKKGEKPVWGGPAARELIGLQAGVHAKVTPGNHSAYDIFVQSTSVNRKLPRGTKVLVDTAQTQSMQPTWGTV